MIKVFYDDYEITKHFIVAKIETDLIAPVTNSFLEMDSLDGSIFDRSRLGRKQITLVGSMHGDMNYHKDELNKVLNVREPKKLTISRYPGRYLLCKLDGETNLNESRHYGFLNLTFISPNYYWNAIGDDYMKRYDMGNDGSIKVVNNGSAPTPPIINIDFEEDCGYIAIVGPDKFIAIGNPDELDKISVPPTESAVKHNFTNLNGWTRVDNIGSRLSDYNKITSKGTGKISDSSLTVNKSTFTGLEDDWQGHAYIKPFDMGTIERKADNFKLRAKLTMHDTAGNRGSTANTLMVVLDDSDRPIMTTSIYDSTSDRKKLTVTFKINSFKDGDNKHSSIIHTGTIDALNGNLEMVKSGNKFEWLVHTDSVNVEPVPVKVGDIIKLKPSATKAATGDYYRNDYKNREYRVGLINKWPGSNKDVYHLYIGDHVIYHVYLEDIEQATVVSSSGTKQVRHSIVNNQLAQLNPSKILIYQGVWGDTEPYSRFNISNVNIDRLYATNSMDIENIFRAGDNLNINNQTGDILHNGTTFQGFWDYDSRFFDLDWGSTELQVHTSEWASLPNVELYIQERWL